MIRFIGSLQLSYRRIGNEKVTVYFQLITLKFPVSNNLCKNTHNFRKNQILLSSTVHPCYSSNYESGIISISVRSRVVSCLVLCPRLKSYVTGPGSRYRMPGAGFPDYRWLYSTRLFLRMSRNLVRRSLRLTTAWRHWSGCLMRRLKAHEKMFTNTAISAGFPSI